MSLAAKKEFIKSFSGEGDTGDIWPVVCDGDFWSRDEAVMFKHVDTGEQHKEVYYDS